VLARKSEKELAFRSSAAEYLTFVAATGESDVSFEMRYENENIWLTQKMMATLYDVPVAAINQRLKKVFEDGELRKESVIKKYLITAADGRTCEILGAFQSGTCVLHTVCTCEFIPCSQSNEGCVTRSISRANSALEFRFFSKFWSRR